MGRLSSTESGEGGMTPVSEEAVIESALGLCLQCIGFLMRRGARLGAGLLSVFFACVIALNAYADGIESISAGANHTCVTTTSAGLKCWGLANLGRLGVKPSDAAINNSTPDPRNTPLDVPTLSPDIAVVSLGGDMSCAESTGLVLKCWGDNSYGQLGTGSTEKYSYVPTEVKDVGGAAFVSVGKSSACAVTAMGGIKCWGRNNFGQIGDGSAENRAQPVAVSGIVKDATDVSVGDDHACAVVGGGVKCWGRNNLGQLGNVSTVDSKVPVAVSALNQVARVYVGAGISYAVTSTGAVKMWGWGRANPTDFTALGSNIAALALGDLHGCALTLSGGVRCWGSNSRGQLGDGTQTDRQTPVDVVGLTSGVIGIAAGKEHSCALKANGEVVCWGAGSSGQLGEGISTLRDSVTAPEAVSTKGGENQTASHTNVAVSSLTAASSNSFVDTTSIISGSAVTQQPVKALSVSSTVDSGMTLALDFNPGTPSSMIMPVGRTTAGVYLVASNASGETHLLRADSAGKVAPIVRLYPTPASGSTTDTTGLFFTIPAGFSGAGETWYTDGTARGTLKVPCSGAKFRDGSVLYYAAGNGGLGSFDLSSGLGSSTFVKGGSLQVDAVVDGIPVNVSSDGQISEYNRSEGAWRPVGKLDLRVTNKEWYPKDGTFYFAGERSSQVCVGTSCRTSYGYEVYRIKKFFFFGLTYDLVDVLSSPYDEYTRAWVSYDTWLSPFDGNKYWIYYIRPPSTGSATSNADEQARLSGFQIRPYREVSIALTELPKSGSTVPEPSAALPGLEEKVYAQNGQLYVLDEYGKVMPHRGLTWNSQTITPSLLRLVDNQLYVFGSTSAEGAEVWVTTLDECPSDWNKRLLGVCGCGVADVDTDRDGTMDCNDSCKSDPLKVEPGQCGCGVKDEDPDRDGAMSCKDMCPNDPQKIVRGVCGCGFADTDTDGDGKADCVDSCAADPNKFLPGACGCGVADRDSDGDGVIDCQDQCIFDGAKREPGACGCGRSDVDSDRDGVADCKDGCPADSQKTDPGISGCGKSDKDTDADGAPDVSDGCPTDKSKLQPGACGCGVADTDTDGDSMANCVDQCPADSKKSSPGMCGCGVADTDSDRDGFPDCTDECKSDPQKMGPGLCGCGVSDVDSDRDGMADCHDDCDTDPRKQYAGDCGCGTPDTDTNLNGTADCKDVDPDLGSPVISKTKGVVRVVFPKKSSISYWYTSKFLDNRGKVIKKTTGTGSSGEKLNIIVPSRAKSFVVSFSAKGPGYKDAQSGEFKKSL